LLERLLHHAGGGDIGQETAHGKLLAHHRDIQISDGANTHRHEQLHDHRGSDLTGIELGVLAREPAADTVEAVPFQLLPTEDLHRLIALDGFTEELGDVAHGRLNTAADMAE